MRHLFGGVVNVHDPGKLGFGEEVMLEMVNADNTEISDRFGGRRRLGRTEVLSGARHSGWSTLKQDKAFLVSGGVLKQFNTDHTETSLKTLSTNTRMSYAEVNNVVICSNGTDIGVIEDGAYYDIQTPSTQFKQATPPASHLCFFNGRVYGASGSVITLTDPFNLESVDTRYSRIPIDGAIQMLVAVQGGVWLSTDKEIIFLRGTGPEDFSYERKADYPCIPYAYKQEFAETFNIESGGVVAVFGTTKGICIGTSDGQLLNLSREKVEITPGQSGTILTKTRNGQTHIILSLSGVT